MLMIGFFEERAEVEYDIAMYLAGHVNTTIEHGFCLLMEFHFAC